MCCVRGVVCYFTSFVVSFAFFVISFTVLLLLLHLLSHSLSLHILSHRSFLLLSLSLFYSVFVGLCAGLLALFAVFVVLCSWSCVRGVVGFYSVLVGLLVPLSHLFRCFTFAVLHCVRGAVFLRLLCLLFFFLLALLPYLFRCFTLCSWGCWFPFVFSYAVLLTIYGNSLYVCSVGGDACIHSNVTSSLLSPAYSKNSPSLHTCPVTGIPSVNNRYITTMNTITPTSDTILPIELI